MFLIIDLNACPTTFFGSDSSFPFQHCFGPFDLKSCSLLLVTIEFEDRTLAHMPLCDFVTPSFGA